MILMLGVVWVPDYYEENDHDDEEKKEENM